MMRDLVPTATEYVSLPYKGVSLRWYARPVQPADLLYAARNSIVLPLQATTVAILLGRAVAIAITRYRFPGRGLINVLVNAAVHPAGDDRARDPDLLQRPSISAGRRISAVRWRMWR